MPTPALKTVEAPAVRASKVTPTLAALTPRQRTALDHLGREKLVAMYRTMFLVRSFEQRCEQMYQQRKIGGFLHLYMGQEALGVGFLAAIRPDDYVTTSYRDHGLALARGIPAGACMAELFGKATGVSTASSADKFPSAPAPPSARSTGAPIRSAWCSSATAPSPRGPSTSP
jgi:TPP-dependent pyruvate/acetoin dehydrogenase alpha subunit